MDPSPSRRPTSLLDILVEYATREPDRPLLIEDKSTSLSYLEARILSLDLLPARIKEVWPSLVPGTTVAILTRNNTLFPLTLLALWSMSVIVVPMSTNADPSLWCGMISKVSAGLVLAETAFCEVLRHAMSSGALVDDTPPPVVDLRSVLPMEFLEHRSSPSRASDWIDACHVWLARSPAGTTTSPQSLDGDTEAVKLFTSSAVDASTLKCVPYTHTMLIESTTRAMLMLGGDEYSSTPKCHLGWLPLSHCFELCISFCGIVMRTGGSYVFFDSQISSPAYPSTESKDVLLLDALSYYGNISSTTAIPAVASRLPETCTDKQLQFLRALHSFGVGGAKTPEPLFQWAAAQRIPYFDCSGATEAAGTIGIRRALNEHQRANGLEIIPGLMGILEKESLTDLYGELVIRATHLPKGYDSYESAAYHYEPTTGVTTYRTGDLYQQQVATSTHAILRGDPLPPYTIDQPSLSGLSYIGRMDDMVVLTTGTKVDALALERQLDGLNGIARSAVVASTNGRSLLALLQPATAQPSPIALLSFIDAVLELNVSFPLEKRIPRENIYFVAELPTTTKYTLHRKKVKHAFGQMVSDDDIPVFFPPPNTNDAQGIALETAVTRQPSRVDGKIRQNVAVLLSRVHNVPSDYFTRSAVGFAEQPLTSLASARLSNAIYTEFGVRITAAQLYGMHSLDDLCAGIVAGSEGTSQLSVAPRVMPSSLPPDPLSAIAISGVACHFAGGIDSMDDLWESLLNPTAFLKTSATARPPSRWASPHSHEDLMFPSGWLDDSLVLPDRTSFAEFFRLTPLESRALSPNARLALQLGYQAIEDAGIAPSSLNGKNWGVFTAVNEGGWRERRVTSLDLTEYAMSMYGSASDAVGARLSYLLNLEGPAIALNTACSSSAVAIHQACSAIRAGDCDAAIVIAATTHFFPAGAIFRSQNGIVSSSGRCMPFADAADGFVSSEGAAAVVLQRTEDVGAPAYALVRSSAVGQDGQSRGFFAPNPAAQSRVIQAALKKGSCGVNDIGYVEAHGTGTELGDAIEIEALQQVFGSRTMPLPVGSIKAVVGHTEECAGLAGILKALCCLKNNMVPAQPRFGPLNKAFDSDDSVIAVATRHTPFLRKEAARLVGISSFGLSGTLAHVIVQEAEFHCPSITTRGEQVFLITAKTSADFLLNVSSHLDFFQSQHFRFTDLEAICRTTQHGRDHHEIRRSWIVSEWKDLLGFLREALHCPPPRPVVQDSPRLGVWFSLPVTREASSRFPLVINQRILPEPFVHEWHAEYSYPAYCLAIAQWLQNLSQSVTVVGGEGPLEYVAAMFSGLLLESEAFQRCLPVDEACITVSAHCPESLLEQALLSWTPAKVQIYGRHADNVFTLRGHKDALAVLAQDSELNINLNASLPRNTVLEGTALHAAYSLPIVSGHIRDVLDQDLAHSIEYWREVQSRSIDTAGALEALRERCDMVVRVCWEEPDTKHGCICVTPDTTLPSILGSLFEVGCQVDWSMLGADSGARYHLPPYQWASHAAQEHAQ